MALSKVSPSVFMIKAFFPLIFAKLTNGTFTCHFLRYAISTAHNFKTAKACVVAFKNFAVAFWATFLSCKARHIFVPRQALD